MSTRDDWLHATLVPSTIAASAPYPHGYVGAQHVRLGPWLLRTALTVERCCEQGGVGFWDQDTFQAPPLMVFHPTIARNLIDNRLFQLPAYRLNAKAFGLRGAYVPWEVGYSGGFARDDLVNHVK